MRDLRVSRWLKFNTVGLAGMALQLVCLSLLVHGAGLHYLPATLLAVQCAVLHNFAWHQRWTWADRPVAGLHGLMTRFARFQALNGGLSLAVNSGVMIWLAGTLGLEPVLAGLAGIGLASVLNFFASDVIVFGRPAGASTARRPRAALGVAVSLLAFPAMTWAEPGEIAVAAWTRHQASVDARYRAAGEGRRPFFILDTVPAGHWRSAILAREIVVRQMDAPDVEGGRIHHWAGAVFIPGTTVAELVQRLQQNAGREARVYDEVIESRLLWQDGDRLRIFMKLRRSTVITATFNTEHEVEYRQIAGHRASSRSISVRIAEVMDAGTAQERERSPTEDRGLLWRLNAYWRFEQAGDGVIVECESVSLSRAVPSLLRPVAGPVIARVAREALQRTLEQFRGAIP